MSVKLFKSKRNDRVLNMDMTVLMNQIYLINKLTGSNTTPTILIST